MEITKNKEIENVYKNVSKNLQIIQKKNKTIKTLKEKIQIKVDKLKEQRKIHMNFRNKMKILVDSKNLKIKNNKITIKKKKYHIKQMNNNKIIQDKVTRSFLEQLRRKDVKIKNIKNDNFKKGFII